MTTTGDILNQLISEQRISEEQRVKALELANETNTRGLDAPWYIQLFMGFGAWLSAGLATTCGIIPLLISIGLASNSVLGVSAILIGVTLCALATVVQISLARSIFLVQLALAVSLIGQSLFIFGEATLFNGVVIVAAFVLFLFYGTLLIVYPNTVHRILATLGVIAAVTGMTYDWIDTIGRATLHFLPLPLTAIAALLWLRETDWTVRKLERLTHPIAYGCIIAALVLDWGVEIGEQVDTARWQPFFITPGITLITIVAAWMIMRANNSTVGQRFMMLFGLIIIAILTIYRPSLMLSLLIILVGYARGHRIVIGVGILSLVGSLIFYFTTLPIDNVQRSMALIGTGIVLLIVRRFLLPRPAAPAAPPPVAEASI